MRQLLAAAMRACEHHGDGPEAREQMRAGCLATPPELRAELLAHFQQQYPEQPAFADDRVRCTDCRYLWREQRCTNHRAAGLAAPEVAGSIKALPQRCPGFAPRG